MVVPPGDSIQTDFLHSAYQKLPGPNVCTSVLENLDTPEEAFEDAIGLPGKNNLISSPAMLISQGLGA